MINDGKYTPGEVLSAKSLNKLVERVDNYQATVGDVQYFSTTASYVVGDRVIYKPVGSSKNYLYRCTANRGPGAWNDNSFEQTSMYEEILRIEGGVEIEEVYIKVMFNNESELPEGFKMSDITVYFEDFQTGTTTSHTLNEDGTYVFQVPRGDNYGISVTPVAGYVTPASVMHTANILQRTVVMKYRLIKTGWYVVDKDGNDEVDIELWDPARNEDAVLLEYNDGEGHVWSVKKNVQTAYGLQWSMANVTFADGSFELEPTNGQTGRHTYSTWNITKNNLEWDFVKATTQILKIGKRYVAAGTIGTTRDITVGGVTYTTGTPAARFARQCSVTIGDEVFYGSLPSMPIINMFANSNGLDVDGATFYTEFATNLAKIGGTAINPRSGGWWCSSQYNSNSAWYLGNGSRNYSGKTATYISLFVVYDLSAQVEDYDETI